MILAQVPMPTEGQGAWMWVAVILAMGGGYLGNRYLNRLDAEKKEDREDLKTCNSNLGATVETLRTSTDVIERQRQVATEGFSRIETSMAEGFDQLSRRIESIEDHIAPRQSPGRRE